MSYTLSLSAAVTDPKRLDALHATELLDSPPEEAFDRLARIASTILNTPVALVSLVDKNRQFLKSQFGLPEPFASKREIPLSHSFCQHVVANPAPLMVADAREHPVHRHNMSIADLRLIAYLGVPLKSPDGQTLGTLCTLDPQPRSWSPREVSLLQDLACSVMTEIELRMLARQHHASYLALREIELQRDDLTNMLVHDMRNPLTALLMGLELAQAAPGLAPEHGRYLTTAAKGGQSLLRMINELLDVGKAEAGRLALENNAFAPRRFLTDACALVEQLAAKRQVTLCVEVDAKVPDIQGDAEKLCRVMVNLVSNAIQHTPPNGKVTVSAALGKPPQETLVFEVRDTGEGIACGNFGRIFEKYGRVIPGGIGKISTGLGLPFCKMVVEAHGGKISVESELGVGTVFRFEIPLKPKVEGGG